MLINFNFFSKVNNRISISDLLSLIDAVDLNDHLSLNDNIENIGIESGKSVWFFSNKKYAKELKNIQSNFCFITKGDERYLSHETLPIFVNDSYLAIAKLTRYFYGEIESLGYKIDKIEHNYSNSVIIDKSAKICENVQIGENVVIGKNVIIGKNSIIGNNVVIKDNVKIGESVLINNFISIEYAVIGNKCIFQNGCKIGQDGFGFVFDKKNKIMFKVPQMGLVIIGNDVEIGANTCIDRGSFNDTIIGNGVKLDNLIQIGHNVKIGDFTVIAGQAGVAGSTEIGFGCQIGAQSGISGHLKIGNFVRIAGKSGVIQDIESNSVIGGYPAINIKSWHRMNIILKKMIKKN